MIWQHYSASALRMKRDEMAEDSAVGWTVETVIARAVDAARRRELGMYVDVTCWKGDVAKVVYMKLRELGYFVSTPFAVMNNDARRFHIGDGQRMAFQQWFVFVNWNQEDASG